jgi:hypothetical protein
LGSDRYVLTYDNKTIRKAASRASYDFLVILVNSKKYGGGGIYNLYSTCSVDNKRSDAVLIHELGHSIGGLGDEYYTSSVPYIDFYPAGVEPWEPNITEQTERREVKWNEWIDPDTPVPTPWNQEMFDSLKTENQKYRQKMTDKNAPQPRFDSLNTENDRRIDQFFRNQKYVGKVGLYEGSGYSAQNLYRPFIDCRMLSSRAEFDPVCKNAIEKVIDFYTQ